MAKAKKKTAETPKKEKAENGRKLPSSKAGVKKKGPVTKSRSLATTFQPSVSLGSGQEPSNKPSRGAGKKDPWGEEWKPLPKCVTPGAVFAIVDLHHDINMVGKTDKALAYSLKLDLNLLLGPWFPWKVKGRS